MAKNIITLVRVGQDYTMVSCSFEKINDQAIEIIRTTIEKDNAETFSKEEIQKCYTPTFVKLKVDFAKFGESEAETVFDQYGKCIWEYFDGIESIRYVLHVSVIGTPVNLRKVQVDWDTDGEVVDDLPAVVTVPDNISDDEISDWLSDEYGFCHKGYSFVSDLTKDYKAIYKELDQRRRAMNEEIKNHVRDILLQVPENVLDLQASPAYALVDTMADEWVERSIYGVRLNKGNDGYCCIECSMDTECDDENPDTPSRPSWEEDNCIDDFDHYSTINWLSVLNAVVDAVKELKVES